ncbi:MAG: hypothetical protein ACO1N9_06235 [Flavobacterium sp.]
MNGKVTSTLDDLEGIYVINKSAGDLTVTTGKGGYFTIPVAVGDVLLFSSITFVAKEITITKEDLANEVLFVQLEFMVRELDEVTITQYKNLNSEALGLVPSGQKRYTPAERKLATAADMRMNPMGFDPLINWISGRTAMLKKELKVEKKERLMEKINYIYTEEQIINEFKIPEEYVQGFIYYIVEDTEFAAALRAKNDTMARFLLNGLSVQYREIIADAK